VPKTEDGEFELILGNRQLLSVFFIVVILLGVFFTMGYIVGRNSGPTATETLNASREPSPAVESTARPAEAPKLPGDSAPVETAAQQPADTGTTSAPAPIQAKAESKQDKSAKSKTPAVSSEPVDGRTYLQLAATSKHEADIMVDVLRNKGFRAIAVEIEEKRGTFRVLVGPVSEGGTNKLRADLQASGFPGNAGIRRTF
jgi:SPOR domain